MSKPIRVVRPAGTSRGPEARAFALAALLVAGLSAGQAGAQVPDDLAEAELRRILLESVDRLRTAPIRLHAAPERVVPRQPAWPQVHDPNHLQVDCYGESPCCVPDFYDPIDNGLDCGENGCTNPDCYRFTFGMQNPNVIYNNMDIIPCYDLNMDGFPNAGACTAFPALCDDWGLAARFTSPHRIRILQVEVGLHSTCSAASDKRPLDLYIWADDGGHRPDPSRVLASPGSAPALRVLPNHAILPDGSTFCVEDTVKLYEQAEALDVTAANLIVEPYEQFHVGARWPPYWPGPVAWCPGDPVREPGTSIVLDFGADPERAPARFRGGPRTTWEDNLNGYLGLDPCLPAPSWSNLGRAFITDAHQDVYLSPLVRLVVECLDGAGSSIPCDVPEVVPDASRRFTDVTVGANPEQDTNPLAGERAAWGDVDGDGYDDLLLGGANGLRLWWNRFLAAGAPRFVDATATRFAVPLDDYVGGVFTDVDNDGDLDVIAFGRPDAVFLNNGNGFFAHLQNSGLGDGGDLTLAVAVGDLDGDGNVDLYFANGDDCKACPLPLEYLESEGGPCTGPCDADCGGVLRNPCLDGWGTQDRIFRGDGDGTFTDITELAGVEAAQVQLIRFADVNFNGYRDFVPTSDPAQADATRYHAGRGAVIADWSGTGRLDVYVVNDLLQPNFYWRNDGNFTFSERAVPLGLAGREPLPACSGHVGTLIDGNERGNSLGAIAVDFDRDGRLDLVLAQQRDGNMRNFMDRTRAWRSVGADTFLEVTSSLGLPHYDMDMAPSFADYDNDGEIGLFLSVVNAWDEGWMSRAFRHRSDTGAFVHDSYSTELFVEDTRAGVAWSDFDNDGDVDVFARHSLLRNRTRHPSSPVGGGGGTAGNWLQVRVEGCSSNRDGIGAKVVVETAGRVLLRQVLGGSGSGSQDSLIQHFGLGDATHADSVTVTFPRGIVVSQPPVGPGVPAGQRYLVAEIGAGVRGPARVCVGGSGTFEADSCGADPNRFTYRWACDGDGVFDDGTGTSTTCTFTVGGRRKVELEATDSGGGSVEIAERWVLVEQPPILNLAACPQPVVDAATCTGQGIIVDWQNCPAVFRNDTSRGDYNLYRVSVGPSDPCPVATDPTWTLISDPTRPLDRVYFDVETVIGGRYCYRIEAEDSTPNSDCTRGPRNGGATTSVIVGPILDDDNRAPPPPDIWHHLRATRTADNRVRWDWSTFRDDPGFPGSGIRYRLYRAQVAQLVLPACGSLAWAPVPSLDGISVTAAEDPPSSAPLVYYEIRGKDTCGNVSCPDTRLGYVTAACRPPAVRPSEPCNQDCPCP